MYIVASDDVTTQIRKLKPTVSLQKSENDGTESS